jgi:hypothetical protein
MDGKIYEYDKNELKFIREANLDDSIDKYWLKKDGESVAWIPL